MVQPLRRKHFWQFLRKLNTELLNSPAIFTFRCITKELETRHQINIYRPMLIAVLFTIAKRWKETICPPTDERINKKVTHTDNQIFAHKKKWVLIYYNVYELPKHAMWNQPDRKCDSIYMKYQNRGI